MSNDKHIFNLTTKQLYIALVIISSITIIVCWILSILFTNETFTFSGLGAIHKHAPILWVIDLLPLIILLIVNVLKSKLHNYFFEVSNRLEKQTMNINKVVEFAEKIGEGKLDSQYDLKDSDDRLGKTLIDMRDKLLDNFRNESKQNWIAKGRDQISAILRNYTDLNELSYEVLHNLITYIDVIQGVIYLYDDSDKKFKIASSFAYNRQKNLQGEFSIGEGLVGEAAIDKITIYRTEIPDDYVTITSGILGDKKPVSLLIIPMITEENLMGALEFAPLKEISPTTLELLEELSEIIARTIYNLKLNQRTAQLLEESQGMTSELRRNEDQLRQNAEEMRMTQEELQKTNIKLAEQFQEVENSQKRLHSLLENASEVISIYDKSKTLIYMSPSSAKIFGYTQEEMMGGKDIDRLTPKGQTEYSVLIDDLLNTPGAEIVLEYTYMRKDNEKIFIETKGRNLLHDPAIHGLILNSRDITERKRAEKEERMRSKMQALSENSPDLIIRLDLRGRFYYANPVVKDFTGIESTEFFRKTFEDLPELNQEYVELWSTLIKEVKAAKDKLETELVYHNINGEERIMDVNAIPEYSEDGKLETILLVSHDITEQKVIEMEIKEKNKKISDSINYAKRLQNAILPDNKLIQKSLEDSFMFYRPKDIVSGDFPWFFLKGDDIYLAAVDCTGHGVPGAMLSLIGYFQLNNVLDSATRDLNAGEILDLLHIGVKKTLRQEDEGAEARDGMDVALCKINKVKGTLDYAGAHRPLYYLHENGELLEVKGSPKAIGGIPRRGKPDEPFENHQIVFKKGDAVFFNSDGYPDQFGGPDIKKYGPARIRENIVSHSSYTMLEYGELFDKEHTEWRGPDKQFDDVLMIGIRF